MRTIFTNMSRRLIRQKLLAIPQQPEKILQKVGDVIFRRIHKAFITKSQGGTDEAGERWKLLAKITVLKRLRKKHPTTDRPSSALSFSQRDKWWKFYRYALAIYHKKDIAAKIAWMKLKRQGGVGVFDKYGASSVLIMRDTEALVNSFVAGPHKIFRIKGREAELGTNRKGATTNHKIRRLWPEVNHWPSSWWQEVLLAAREEIIEQIVEVL